MIATKRLPNGNTAIFSDTKEIGYIVSFKDKDFGLYLKGIYWTKGEPNIRGGNTGKLFKRKRDIIADIERMEKDGWFNIVLKFL